MRGFEKMKNKTTMFLIIIILMLSLIVACNNTNQISQNNSKNPIKLGVISPLTGSASSYGDPAAKSITLAAEEINKNGGINGRQILLVVEDGKCDGKTSVDSVNKLINIDKVKIILGGHCSTESLAIAPILNENKIIQLASLTSSPDYTNSGDYSFRNMPSAKYFAGKEAEIAYQKGARNIAVLTEQKEFPKGVSESFKKRFVEIGGTVVIEQNYLPDENNFRTYLTKIKQTDADSMFFSPQSDVASVIFYKQMKELGMIDKYVQFTNNGGLSKKAFNDSEGIMSNIISVTAYVNPEKKDTKIFLENYKGRYGEYPTTQTFFAASSYDAVYLIKDAIESCNDVDVECVKNFLYGVKDWQGAAGELTLDENGDAATSIGWYYFNEEGKEIWQEI